MPDPIFAAPDGEEYTDYPESDLLVPRPARPAPEGLEEFWLSSYKDLTRPEIDARLERDESGTGRLVQQISFRSSMGARAKAWIVGPTPGTPVRGGQVISHGYGGRAAPEPEIVPRDSVAIFPVAPWSPDNEGGLPSAKHVLLGIGARERYSHRFCVADIWRAASALLRRFPQAAGRLDFRGGSFGGGIGAMALPWDSRFRRAVLDVPSFGDYPTRLGRRSTGSCEAVRLHLQRAPDDRAMLDYFDSAIAARSITIPVLVAAARRDPAVDPRGQFAVYHALAGTKRLVIRSAGHMEFDTEQAEEAVVESVKQRFLAANSALEIPVVIHADGDPSEAGADRDPPARS